MNRYYSKTGKPNVYEMVMRDGKLVEVSGFTCNNQLKASLCCRILNQCGRGCLSNRKG